jgi:hypothetical protein
MSEDKNIEEQTEGYRPPKTDDSEKAAEESSFSSEQKKTVDEENIHDSTPNIHQNNKIMEVHHHGHVHENKK